MFLIVWLTYITDEIKQTTDQVRSQVRSTDDKN